MDAQMLQLNKNLETITTRNADFEALHKVWKQFQGEVQKIPRDETWYLSLPLFLGSMSEIIGDA